jgi:acyl carrier protein
MKVHEQHEQIVDELIDFIIRNNPAAREHLPFPRDESLFEKGILDSVGVVELVAFVEERWSIEILDEEITVERFGSLNKMAKVILESEPPEDSGSSCNVAQEGFSGTECTTRRP